MHAFFFYAQNPDFHKLGLCYYLLKANKNHAYGKNLVGTRRLLALLRE